MARNQYGQDDISHTFTERALSETWEDRKARRAAEAKPSDVLKGRPRAEWTWSDAKKRRFAKMWMDGVAVKIIMAELDIGSKSAVSQAVKTHGLPSRLRKGGDRPLLKARLTEAEMSFLRKRASSAGATISRYVQRLVRIDMGMHQ